MKKLFALILMFASIGFAGSWSETSASTVAAAGKPQVRIQIGRHRRRNRDWRIQGERVGYGYGRVITQSRLVRRGWHTYRETYQIRYLPNGRTQTTLISRVRLN